MHINFKYFIVSIGSIFLALGIGILVGSSLGNNETIQKQNEAIVKDIDEQFNELKTKDEQLSEENSSLKENMGKYKKYIESNEALLTAGKLTGKQVGIISFSEKDSSENLDSVIANAGGNVAFDIVINESLFEKGSAQKINEKLQTNISKDSELIDLVSDAIKESDSNGRLNVLSELGYVKVEKYTNQFDAVNNIVVFNNPATKMKNKVATLEKPVIESLKSEKPVLVVQNSSSNKESLKELSKLRVATINNIDQSMGHISLITCLTNDKIIGDFGKTDDNMVTIPVTK
ncbi:MAG: copper transporter [Peptostreptococcus sp.]|uniref:copper transporter n=1 Tax=Peptostreptococcus sp. TaxID=1262 RepID=UPI002FC7A9AC